MPRRYVGVCSPCSTLQTQPAQRPVRDLLLPPERRQGTLRAAVLAAAATAAASQTRLLLTGGAGGAALPALQGLPGRTDAGAGDEKRNAVAVRFIRLRLHLSHSSSAGTAASEVRRLRRVFLIVFLIDVTVRAPGGAAGSGAPSGGGLPASAGTGASSGGLPASAGTGASSGGLPASAGTGASSGSLLLAPGSSDLFSPPTSRLISAAATSPARS